MEEERKRRRRFQMAKYNEELLIKVLTEMMDDGMSEMEMMVLLDLDEERFNEVHEHVLETRQTEKLLELRAKS